MIGCFAHVRRKFDEALKSMTEKDRIGSKALEGLEYCNQLFSIERKLENLTPEERYEQRQEQSNPVLEVFLCWLKSVDAIPKSALGKAVHYALDQWPYLEHFLLDGRLEISNNRAERSIKPFVIGRKNFLFSNNPKGAVASATIYSIIETAKESGLNPMSYLTFLFEQAPNMDFHTNPELLQHLLPWSSSLPESCRAPAKK
jgi:transposase